MNRVRYAPSPTGLQHIGGLRTALFNYFYARSTGGVFVLRVEDTDRQRFDSTAMDDLYEMFDWMGIEYDEGPGKEGEFEPYVQSERLEIYRKKASELLDKGMAYPCFCSEERLEELRRQQRESSGNIGYDRKCRHISLQDAIGRMQSEEGHVLRFKTPLEGKMQFEDVVLGSIGRKNKDLSPDPIIVKADGYPTYHLANVIDDHLMNISHILRAQEWLPSVPLHLHIYQAFGWSPPVFCHLPMVMGTDGSKLSKRHGSTAVSDFRREGYLPEALMNFVSLLGWSYDDRRQLFRREELCRLFSLDKINKAPAVFDYRKLDWFNGQYIRSRPDEGLKEELRQILMQDGIIDSPPSDLQCRLLDRALPIIKERLKKLNDVSTLLSFIYSDPGLGHPREAVPKKLTVEETCTSLNGSMEIMEKYAESLAPDEEVEERFRELAGENGWKIGDVFQPLRYALTASRISPPIIPSSRLLGFRECEKRIKRLMESLKALE